MKYLAILVAVLAIMLGIYYYLEPDQVRGWLRDTKLVTAPETTRLYKWQDKQGSWHVSDAPPPAGTSFEVRDYRSDENILPLPPQLKKDD